MTNQIKFCSVSECNHPIKARGLCSKHYARLRRNGSPLVTPKFDPIEVRFFRYVEKTDSCWNWTGAKARGYGHFCISQRPTKTVKAHRFSYELVNGTIPQGLTIDHLCRNTLCVNPAHLEAVTQLVNTKRHAKSITHCKNGHEFSEENTYIRTGGINKGRRRCRACERERMRRIRGTVAFKKR